MPAVVTAFRRAAPKLSEMEYAGWLRREAAARARRPTFCRTPVKREMVIEHYLVTVVILTCNRSKYLERCLDSISRQSCTRWKLVVSDCSDDLAPKTAVESMVSDFGRNHPLGKVTFLSQRESLCQAKHLEVALCGVDTGYIALLDDDDFWLEKHLERSLEVLQADHKMGLTVSNGLVVDDRGSIGGLTNHSHYEVPLFGDTSKWLELFLRSFYGSTSAYIIRNEAIEKHVFVKTSCVDIHLAISVLLAGFDVTSFENPSYCYRRHGLSSYRKGYQVTLDRHRLRLHLLETKGWALGAKCPIFLLLAFKSIMELTGYSLWAGLAPLQTRGTNRCRGEA